MSGVSINDEVITQSLTFVATSNAITYCGAIPNFLDVDKDTLSLSPECLREFLSSHCEIRQDGFCWNKLSNRRIKSCIIMHTFGLAGRVDELKEICDLHNIILIEDAAESLGTFIGKTHTGTIADIGIMSFNGNKIITTGGGGMILTQKKDLGEKFRHITTTAKVNHEWHFDHDEIGFNYRMPNLNAALGVAQMKKLNTFLETKRKIASSYQKWGKDNSIEFITEIQGTTSNYWLNALLAENIKERDDILEITNKNGVMTRPAWKPMHQLKINQKFETFVPLVNTEWLFERIVCMPSSFSKDPDLS
jgi:dTDP-4-amino-4,6-dideoxygalactose transaminase